MLVNGYQAAVHRQRAVVQLQYLALGRYVHRSKVVHTLQLTAAVGEETDVSYGRHGVGNNSHTLSFGPTLEAVELAAVQRHIISQQHARGVYSIGASILNILITQSQTVQHLLHRLRRYTASIGHKAVGGLCILGGGYGLAVNQHLLVDNLQRLARHTDAALDIVRLAVQRPHKPPVAQQLLIVVAHSVVVCVLVTRAGMQRGVALREVEDHGVVALHLGVARVAVIRQLEPAEVALHPLACQRQRVVHQRHRQRRHSGTGAISQFAHQQVVARHQATLHRARRDIIELEGEAPDNHSCYNGKDYRVQPVASLADLSGRLHIGVVIFQFGRQAHNRQIDPWEQHRKELFPETVAAEHFGSLHHQQQIGEDIDCRHKEVDVPLPTLAAHLDPHHEVIERYHSLPRRHTGFLEDKPQTHHRAHEIQ